MNEARGDTINVVNTPFQLPEEVEPLPDIPIWEQAWVLSLAKQLLGALAVLFIAIGVLRPMLRNLSTHGKYVATHALPAGQAAGQLALGEDQLYIEQPVTSEWATTSGNGQHDGEGRSQSVSRRCSIHGSPRTGEDD